MNVLVIEPGVRPYEKRINGLSEMQELVEGEIEAIYPFGEQIAVVRNLDGHAMKLPFNRSVPGKGIGIFGTFFICRRGSKGFCSLTREQIKHYRSEFYEAELLLRMNGTAPITVLLPPRPRDRPSRQQKNHSGHDSR